MTRVVSSTALESRHTSVAWLMEAALGAWAVMLPWEPSHHAPVSRPTLPQLVARVAACPGGACSASLILCTAHIVQLIHTHLCSFCSMLSVHIPLCAACTNCNLCCY